MNDHNKSNIDPSDEPSRIEQHLKQFRPRAQQLDIAAITLAAAQSLQPSAPPTIRQAERTGVTAAQFATQPSLPLGSLAPSLAAHASFIR